MATICEPDTYEPTLNEDGTYVDMLQFTWPSSGFRCNCGTRKDKVFTTRGKFAQHTKTKGHEKWLNSLTNNKMNHYNECIRLEKINKEQQQMITKYTNEISQKEIIISALTRLVNIENSTPATQAVDLLTFD